MGEVAALRSVFFEYQDARDRGIKIFEDFSLSVAAGETTVVLGPSGCGKTTLVRLMGGLLKPSRGHIVFLGQEVDGQPSRERQIVFQDESCFPWLTVEKNIRFACMENEEEFRSVLSLVKLEDFRDFMPGQLSLGMRQRVGLARSLVGGTAFLMLDEPLRALDAFTRSVLQDELREILRQSLKAALWVTHDLEEALIMGDRIVVIGGTPAKILHDFRSPNTSGALARLSEEFHRAYVGLYQLVLKAWKEV